jgi:ABC-type transport system substrate-binding protein
VNVPRYCDPTIDELLAKQAASTDQDERAAIWQEISQRIADNYTTIWAAHSSWRIAYDSTRVRGLCDAKGQGGEPLKCVVAGRTALAQIWLAE